MEAVSYAPRCSDTSCWPRGKKNGFFSFSFSLCLSVVKRRDFFSLCPLSLFCLEIFVFRLIFLRLLSLLTCLYFFPSFSLPLAFPSLLPSILPPSSSLPFFLPRLLRLFLLPSFLPTNLSKSPPRCIKRRSLRFGAIGIVHRRPRPPHPARERSGPRQ